MRVVALGAVLALMAPSAWAVGAAKTCNVRAFGAKGDGVTKDTAAIQKAIDVCAVPKSGGVVVLRGGTFLSGPISLRSNITLEIEKGATLLGSPDRADYPKFSFAGKETVQPLVSVVKAENVTIDGGGIIDGNGHVWWEYVKGVKDSGVLGTDHPRPMGVVFDHVKHVRMHDVTVQNSGFWQIVPYYSDDMVFQNMRILAPPSPNTDALDPFSSSHILIDHVYSKVGDDNIAIKSGAIDSPGPDAPSQYITITNCTFAGGHGLSIGSEVSGGVRHVHAEHIHIEGTRWGIRIKSARDRGHDISDITYKDIDIANVNTAILITEYYGHKEQKGEAAAVPVTRLTPYFHDISMENVHATGIQNAGEIVGLPESPVKDLTLKNVSIEAQKGMEISYADVVLDHVKVTAAKGEGITVAPTAKVVTK